MSFLNINFLGYLFVQWPNYWAVLPQYRHETQKYESYDVIPSVLSTCVSPSPSASILSAPVGQNIGKNYVVLKKPFVRGGTYSNQYET